MEARESIGTKKVETKWKKSRKWSDSVSKKRVQECCGDAISETSMKQWIPLNEFKWKPMAATIRRVYKTVEQVSLWLALHYKIFSSLRWGVRITVRRSHLIIPILSVHPIGYRLALKGNLPMHISRRRRRNPVGIIHGKGVEIWLRMYGRHWVCRERLLKRLKRRLDQLLKMALVHSAHVPHFWSWQLLLGMI